MPVCHNEYSMLKLVDWPIKDISWRVADVVLTHCCKFATVFALMIDATIING